MRRHIMNTTRLPSRPGSRNTRLSCRKVVWLGVGKKSKKGIQPISHRTPPSSHLSFFRCVPSATPYARSRNFFTPKWHFSNSRVGEREWHCHLPRWQEQREAIISHRHFNINSSKDAQATSPA